MWQIRSASLPKRKRKINIVYLKNTIILNSRPQAAITCVIVISIKGWKAMKTTGSLQFFYNSPSSTPSPIYYLSSVNCEIPGFHYLTIVFGNNFLTAKRSFDNNFSKIGQVNSIASLRYHFMDLFNTKLLLANWSEI